MRSPMTNTFTLPLVLVGLWAGSAMAQPEPPDGRPPHPPHPDEVLVDQAEELGIDEETLAEIKGIVGDARPTLDELHAAVRDERRQFHELLEQDEPDREAVFRQIESIAEAEVALHKLEIEVLLDIRALLTPEQREALGAHAPPPDGPPPPPHGGPGHAPPHR